MVYDGTRFNFSSLQEAFGDYKNFSYLSEPKINDIISDLRCLELLEKKGIKGIKKRVTDLFDIARQDGTLEQRTRACIELNEIFCRAIYLFPHLVKGIEVKLKEGTEQKSEEFFRTYSSDYGRFWYESFFEFYKKEHGVNPTPLVFQLPYGFTTGTHGSGERNAMMHSRDTLALTSILKRDKPSTKIPALALEIRAPLITSSHTSFSLDDVESIQFSDKGDFTPWIDNRQGKDVLIKRGNYLGYYFTFRDFSNFSNFRRGIDGMKFGRLSKEQKDKINLELVEAQSFTNLWHDDYKTGKLETGFLVCWPHSANVGDFVLYELSGIPLPNKNSHEANALLYHEILKNNRDVVSRTKQYKGEDIIKRLVEIPVQPRRF